MAVKTDGYITDSSSGDWRYSNTGQGSRGDVESPFGDAYARFERQDGAIAGTKVDALGVIGAGPVIDFKTLDSLLAGAPSSPGAPNVIWAGVSPLSLSEVLIVWNEPIVMLDQSKIKGGQSVSIAGRLMVVGLAEPIAIDGEEQSTIILQPGAVGTYGNNASCGDPSANITTGEPSGELEALPDVTAPCTCYTPLVVPTGSTAASGQGAQVLDARLFAEQLCQDGGCDPPAEIIEEDLVFTANNQLRIPVRCCHPFYLFKLSVNGDDGDCPCIPCPVWYASMIIYGSTIPGEVLPLDQLFSITDPCKMKDQLGDMGGQFRGILISDVACCGNASVQIVGNFGAALGVSGKWAGRLPGLAGQSAYFVYKNETNCAGTTCETNVYPDDDADPWVEEAILKPRYRALPVSFFDPIKFSTITLSLPKNITTELLTVINSCPTAILSHESIHRVNQPSAVTAAAPPPSTAQWFDGCSGTTIDVCVGGSMTSIFVLTTCTGAGASSVTASLVTLGFDIDVLKAPGADVTVVTSCVSAPKTLAIAADAPVALKLLTMDTNGAVSLPQARSQGCDATWKFVMHNGTPQEWTRVLADVLVPCGPGTGNGCHASRNCIAITPVHPAEVNCAAVNLLTPIWVSSSETLGSDGGCPGYDCSPENAPVPPKGSNVPAADGSPQACGILIRRPQRRPFVRCHA